MLIKNITETTDYKRVAFDVDDMILNQFNVINASRYFLNNKSKNNEIKLIGEINEPLVIRNKLFDFIDMSELKCKFLYVEYDMDFNTIILPTCLESLNILNKNFKNLNLKNNHSIKILDLSSLSLNELPDLPHNLTRISFSNNNIKKLPENISNYPIEYLKCNDNKITSLNKELPNSLKYFDCSNNMISGKLINLPDQLEYFNCSSNGIKKIMNIPTTLENFICDRNPLIYLPRLNQNMIIYFDGFISHIELYGNEKDYNMNLTFLHKDVFSGNKCSRIKIKGFDKIITNNDKFIDYVTFIRNKYKKSARK